MEVMEWDTEDVRDPIEWSDAEFLPMFGRGPRLPSPSSAIASRLFPSRTRRPSPAITRPPATRTTTVPAASASSALAERMRELDERHRAIASQLAILQHRSASQQSSEQFGPMATGAIGALALGFKNDDLFTPAIVQGLPLAHLLASSRGRALTAGFNANPWLTLGFPAAALLLVLFRDRIPGIAKRVVAPPVPQTTFTGDELIVSSVQKQAGAVVKFELGTATPTTNSLEFNGARLAPGDIIKLCAFIDGVPSEVVTVVNPARPGTTGRTRPHIVRPRG